MLFRSLWSILYLHQRLWIAASCTAFDSGIGFDQLHVFHFAYDPIYRSVADFSSVAMPAVTDVVVAVDVSLYFYIAGDR